MPTWSCDHGSAMRCPSSDRAAAERPIVAGRHDGRPQLAHIIDGQ